MDLEHHQLDLSYADLRRRDSRRERHILGSLAEHGQQQPVIVVSAQEFGHYVLVDGYKRVRALKKLGQDTVQALVWEIDGSKALVLERLMRSQEADSPIEEGWLLCALRDGYGLSQEELARRFDRTKSWVSRRIGLVSGLPAEVQEQVRSGIIPSHAAMKYLIPLARANTRDCLQLVAAICEPLSSRQMAGLYAGYRAAEPEAQKRLIADPLLYLHAQEAALKQAALADLPFEQKLLRDLENIAGLARRISKYLWPGLVKAFDDSQRVEIRLAMTQAR